MAQHKWVKAAAGTGIEGVAASSDATSLSSARLWVIVGDTVSRDETIANLKDVLYRIEASNVAFPGA